VTRSGRLLLSILGAFAIATAGVTGVAAAPLEQSANLPTARVAAADAAPAAQAAAPHAAPAAPLEPSANLPAVQAAAADAAPAAGQVTTTQEPADCAPTASAGKPCDPVSPTSETVSPNDAPYSVTLAASAFWVPPNAGVMLTATANQDLSDTPYWIYFLSGGSVVGTPCGAGTTCTTIVSSPTATTRSYTAVIDASQIGTDLQATSSSVTVAWSNVDIEGTVRNASSVGLAGILVSACVAPADAICQSTTSYNDGTYEILVAPSQTYDLEFLDQSGTYWYNFLLNVAVGTTSVTGKDVILQQIPPWTVTLTPSVDTPVLAGTNVTLTAAVNQNPFHSPFYLDIVDGNGAVVAYCTSGTTCVTTVTSSTATSRTYRAVIAHLNGSSEQATSSIVTVVWRSVPGAPTGVTATPGNKMAHVSWTLPPANGSAFTGFTVTASPGGQTCNPPGTATSCAVAFLTNGTAYTFTVVATNGIGPGPASAASNSVTPLAGATYHALTPSRILDSRDHIGGLGIFSSHVAQTFAVTGHGGVPAGATAVTGNLTVTQQTSGGFLYIGPVAANNPTSSTLNFPLGDDRANAVTVALSGTGTLSVTYAASTLGPTAQVIFDVTGYFTPDASGATYHALTPSRILDSRDHTGGLGIFSSHGAQTFLVRGVGGVPASATAVTGNLTVTGQSSAGFLYIGPVGMANPTSSTLNFPLGDDRANAVTVALGGGGTLSVTYAAATLGPTAQVIFDVTGYFTPDLTGAAYVPLTPARILDTRDHTGGLGIFGSHVAQSFAVTGHGGVASGATAVTGNLTVTQQSSAGFLSVGPVAANNPTSSTLNFPLADDRANAVTVALGTGGTLSVTYAAATLGPTAQVIFDVTGYFAP